MAYLAVFEILANFIQYLGIIASIRISWPESWMRYVAVLRYFRLDLTLALPSIEVPPLDFRSQHMLLTNILPLILSLLLLVFFKPPNVVMWYALMLCGILGLVAGVVVTFVLQTSFNRSTGNTLLIASGSLIALLLMILGINRCMYERRKRKIAPEEKTAVDIMPAREKSSGDLISASQDSIQVPDIDEMKAIKPKSAGKQLRNYFLSIVLIIVGLQAIGVVRFEQELIADSLGYASTQFGVIFGYVSLVFGILLFYVWASNLFFSGRRFNTKMNAFFTRNILYIILLAQSLLYIPITTSLVNSVNCFPAECKAGFEFTPKNFNLSMASVQASFLRPSTSADICSSCGFYNGTCSISEKLCPKVTEMRLVADPSISCTQEMYPFYLPGSILTFITFTLGTPYLFYKIIKLCNAFMHKIPSGGDDNERWHIRVYLSQNSCKSLYSDFNDKWKYYRLILIIQKLFLVLIFVIGTYQPLVLAFCMMLSHALFACISFYSQPYHQFFMNILAIVCWLVNSANACVAILIGLDFSIPYWLVITLAVLNVGLPILFVSLALWSNSKEAYSVKRKAVNLIKRQEAASKESLDQETKDLIKAVDEEMNKRLLQLVVNFFLTLGVAALISLCISAIGLLSASSNASYLKHSTETGLSEIQYEYAGYSSWNDFAYNCCCQYKEQDLRSFRNGTSQLVELWKCRSGVYKERLRARSLNDNGLELRDYCGRTFNLCQPEFKDGKIQVCGVAELW